MVTLKNVCIVGLGYMGLPTALLLADAGYKVVGFDVVKSKVDLLNDDKLPFDETGLEELFKRSKHNFKAVHELNKQITSDIDCYIVCVPTPFTKKNTCDLTFVNSAMESIVPFMKKNVLVVLESTVSPGTTKGVVKNILEKSGLIAGKDFYLSYVSEKAIPGNTLYEMKHNARIIGGINAESADMTKKIYSSFVKGETFLTDTMTAETTKLVENTFRDINIAYANELAKICEKLGIDVWEVIALASKHPRVKILSPGPGVGGHCIAIDPWFIIEQQPSALISLARHINDSMPEYVFDKLHTIIESKHIHHPKITILGVAYKKNVDDDRETPANEIIRLCLASHWNVKIHDPFVRDFHYPLTRDFNEAIKDSDVIVIVTDHDYYHDVDLSKHVVLDTRGMNIKAKEYHVLGNGKRESV